ncbi:MAG: endonuclease [Bacteroidales bacterium]|nr:endonuclease [Bacteroidales bacterium]
MKRMKLMLSLVLLATLGLQAAEQPADYYKRAEGNKQKALLSQLCSIISANTKVIAYGDLFEEAYPYTDAEGGYFIDMYSNVKYAINDSRINKTYSTVGQSINREHAFPQSWFKEQSPMKSDLFHVYPTDGYVNNQRSSYPYGECAGGTRITNGSYYGKGRLGNCTAPGYSGKVWEPDDEYKGDFARTYFYMATRYNTQIGGWKGNGTAGQILDGSSYPVYQKWYLDLMLKWHRQDPVSEKEIKRNNAAHDLQKNRNPYIDHPELVEYIWGDMQDAEWYEGAVPTSPVLSLPTDGSTVALGNAYVGSRVSKTIDVKGRNLSEDLTVTVTGTGFSASATTITAAAAMDGATVTVTYSSDVHAIATGTLTIASSEVSATVNLTATASDDMEGLDATNITETSFTANWTPATAVASYTLYVSGKGQITPGSHTLLFDEDMSKGTTNWMIGGRTNKDTGYLRLGTGSGTGSVTSPALDLTSSRGVATAIITCRAYGNDSDVPMVVEILDEDDAVIASESQTITNADATYAILLQGNVANTDVLRISNTASSKRVQLKSVKVYAGDARSLIAEAPAKAPVETGDTLKREITGITDTHYNVTGLARLGTFNYQVKAIYTDGTESALTEAIQVQLKAPEFIMGDVNGDGEVNVSDVTSLVNQILAVASYPAERCDINLDGKIDVSDVTALINIVLAI